MILKPRLQSPWNGLSALRARLSNDSAARENDTLQSAQSGPDVRALPSQRAQLHPHFIFNTLGSIAERVHDNPQLAENLLHRLRDLMRQVMQTSGAHDITLEQELQFIASYIEVEELRLGEGLQVTWDVAPDILEIPVPRGILQPLIENALQHGIAAPVGEVMIRAYRNTAGLQLEMRDNGPGISDPSAPTKGLGLAETRARLKRLYGSSAELRLVNDDGLVAQITIPCPT